MQLSLMLMGTACAAEGKVSLSALGCFSIYMERDDIIHALEQREQKWREILDSDWYEIFSPMAHFPLVPSSCQAKV